MISNETENISFKGRLFNYVFIINQRIMGGFFGVISKSDCVSDLFYGTDYNSHLGTKRGGMAVKNSVEFKRTIHNIENSYFRTKFEPDLPQFRHFSETSDGSTNPSELIAMQKQIPF